uniref:Putative ovule protein n=1 Tax=Solanum chacoense TaxID=4108 RepID=A0A0V0ICM0_SOLCH
MRRNMILDLPMIMWYILGCTQDTSIGHFLSRTLFDANMALHLRRYMSRTFQFIFFTHFYYVIIAIPMLSCLGGPTSSLLISVFLALFWDTIYIVPVTKQNESHLLGVLCIQSLQNKEQRDLSRDVSGW